MPELLCRRGGGVSKPTDRTSSNPPKKLFPVDVGILRSTTIITRSPAPARSWTIEAPAAGFDAVKTRYPFFASSSLSTSRTGASSSTTTADTRAAVGAGAGGTSLRRGTGGGGAAWTGTSTALGSGAGEGGGGSGGTSP